jgi:hypothetical protein
MMYPRFHLTKNLLKDDGIIFISIDDSEVETIKMVMNEILLQKISSPASRDKKFIAQPMTKKAWMLCMISF